jgi:NADPH-dependent 2,4-dienoyl-CoA reductase/sulfur reductase-like enzyme/rhodanese-related sulfurtransferase
MKLLIVGGVAAGASAAVRARRLNESATIVLFERGPDVSFANCGMPYHLGGVISDRSKLLVTPVERLRTRFRLDIRLRCEVVAIDRANKCVTVVASDGDGATYVESYDVLLLAPGANPVVPPWPGVSSFATRVMTLRTLQDMDKIKARLADPTMRRVVLIGGGFIGLELCENITTLNIEVSIVELVDQILPPFDKELTAPIAAALRARGVTLLLGETTEAIVAGSDDSSVKVQLKSGRSAEGQLVIVGIGVRPDSKLAVDAGLVVGPRGGIRVNNRMQTSDAHIYAAGDAVETVDFVLGGAAQVPLGGPANRQGWIAATNIMQGGAAAAFRGVQGSAVIGLYGLTAACTGASEKSLVRAGRAFHAIFVHPSDHAGYYPGASPITLKVLFEPGTGLILGAQAVGQAGVDKRIDVLAMAIQARFTVFDLEQSELCYAPQYGAAKDPVNMAGFVGAGVLRGEHPTIDVKSLMALDPRPLVVDVRTPSEFAAGAIPGAINVPVDSLRERLDEIPADKPVVVYCLVGYRGYVATRVLVQSGRDAKNLSGGFKTWLLFNAN